MRLSWARICITGVWVIRFSRGAYVLASFLAASILAFAELI